MSPFDIGQQFEDFVEKRIFNSSDYTLVEKTHKYDQNKERFVESSLNPDFKFRTNNSIQEFYAEAKYRSVFNEGDKLDLMTPTQFQRFKNLNSTDHPVFLIVGVGGSPANPDILSLIPLSDIKYIDPYRSVILKHKIEKTTYRQRVILRWESKCAVTGFEKLDVLVASHIVPWAASNNQERVDPDNGILMSPTYDALFDRHLISFENSGRIILTDKIESYAFNRIGVTGNEVIKKLSVDNFQYLERHRTSFNERN